MRYDVVVVGGGVAGLAAASRLSQTGRSVTLVEARPRLGGRIHTVIDPAFDHPIELGAEFIQGEVAGLLEVTRAAGIGLLEVSNRHRRARGAENQRRIGDLEELIERLLGLARPDQADVPVAELIREHGAAFSSDDLKDLISYLQGFHAADLERFGSAALAENEKAEERDGPRMFRPAGGFGQLVGALGWQLNSSRAQVRTGTVVTKLRWSPGEVTVEARESNGATIELVGSQGILAVPLGSLKEFPNSEGVISLDPVPQGWGEALAALHLGQAQRIDLRFQEPWWMDDDSPPPSFLHGSDEPFPVWWTTSPPELPFLTGWIGGLRAKALSGQARDRLVQQALQSLSSIFGLPVGTLQRQLQAAYAHDWSSDPFSRGAYSYGGVGALAARALLRRPVAGTLFAAGEAIADQGRNATVAGALLDGYRAAAAVLEAGVALRYE